MLLSAELRRDIGFLISSRAPSSLSSSASASLGLRRVRLDGPRPAAAVHSPKLNDPRAIHLGGPLQFAKCAPSPGRYRQSQRLSAGVIQGGDDVVLTEVLRATNLVVTRTSPRM